MVKIILKITLLLILFLNFQCASDGADDSLDDGIVIEDTIAEIAINKDSLLKILKSLNADEKAAEFHKYFRHLNRAGIFNGNVLVAQKGVVIYKECFGYSDLRAKDSLSFDSKFQIASVSKQFTAVAIMQLVEKGLISYTDTVQKFFPEFPYKDITIHMLLTHKSGLPNYIYLCDRNFKDKDSAVYNDQAIKCLEKLHPPKYYRPGRRFDYSNTGYMVLSSIVSSVSGLPFDKYMKQNIFAPLGMNNTFIYVKGKTKLPPHTTVGYETRRRKAEDIFLNGVTGDKGVYSTVEDLYKWDQGLYKNIIIKYSNLEQAFQPMGKRKWAHKNYGYGWRMYNSNKAGKVLYHAGWWYGYQTLLIRLEEDESTIVVLKNKKTKGIIDQKRLFKILYSDYSRGKSRI